MGRDGRTPHAVGLSQSCAKFVPPYWINLVGVDGMSTIELSTPRLAEEMIANIVLIGRSSTLASFILPMYLYKCQTEDLLRG